MFLYKASSWKRIQANPNKELDVACVLSNEAVHWNLDNYIIASDLAWKYRENLFPAYENKADNSVYFPHLRPLLGG